MIGCVSTNTCLCFLTALLQVLKFELSLGLRTRCAALAIIKAGNGDLALLGDLTGVCGHDGPLQRSKLLCFDPIFFSLGQYPLALDLWHRHDPGLVGRVAESALKRVVMWVSRRWTGWPGFFNVRVGLLHRSGAVGLRRIGRWRPV